MNAAELRIGNLIGLDLAVFPGNEFVVLEPAIFNMKVKQGSQIQYYPAEMMEGIPLTEEWLKKFGIDGKWLFHPIMLHRISKGYNVISNGYKLSYLEYVHNLQNFYYACKGEELTVKS